MNIPSINNGISVAGPGQRDVSSAIDRVFLAEMLKHVSTFAGEGSFSGGVGEEQFASFLAESYAHKLAEKIELGILKTKGSGE